MTPAASRPSNPTRSAAPALGLGLDAGGTQTRWALADADSGTIVAEGHVAGISGMQLASDDGRTALVRALQAMASEVLAHGRPSRLYAGITGLPDADAPGMAQMKALRALGLADEAMVCRSDMDIAWRAAFERPGDGYLLYAGTGAIAAFVDEQGQLQRAGGRGMLLGDEGGGFWIAAQALAHVWRLEDEAPGSAAAASPMARRLFATIGGSEWPATRSLVYASPRGKVGQLALAVAASAEDDPAARDLLLQAGAELARLARCLLKRYGPRPIVASGRALLLSPLIEQGLRAALPPGTALSLQQLHPHRMAALAAARATTSPQ
jgi:N-acetylglucosamine kinase-like BadF-type ATPase